MYEVPSGCMYINYKCQRLKIDNNGCHEVSNLMDDSDVETTESEPLGLLPYRFEPTSDEFDTSSEIDSGSELLRKHTVCSDTISVWFGIKSFNCALTIYFWRRISCDPVRYQTLVTAGGINVLPP